MVLLALALSPLAAAITVNTPKGPADVFSRGELVDVLGLLRLTGATVQFAAAAGSYDATLGEHEVQFTPGGSLAVVDGRLATLPGPVRTVEGRVLGSASTAAALMAPLGWTVRTAGANLELLPLGGDQQLKVDLVHEAAGTLIVLRGTAQRPVVQPVPGGVTVQFPSPVVLVQPVAPEGELAGGELHDRTLTLRLAGGIEVASTYSLDNPPRFVLRLSRAAPLVAPSASPEKHAGPLVVLDPGHGGEDQGAKGPAGELEKDITLAVAHQVASKLQAAGIATRLTRDADETVSLSDRTALANRLHADAFVSIHANASPAHGARGAETYYMNVDATDPQAAQAAARENASVPADTVQLILWDLAHVANLNASARLARTVQERLNTLQGIRDRGIKQAPFVVLTGAAMPATLVEVGFLTNPDEAKLLSSPAGQDELAGALAEAVVTFIRTPEPTAAPTPTP